MRRLRIAPAEGEFHSHLSSSLKRELEQFQILESQHRDIECQNTTPDTKLQVEISGKEHHHLSNVLRVGLGQEVELKLPENTTIWLTEVVHIREATICLQIKSSMKTAQHPSIHLIVGNIRPQKSEELVEQCTAIGVSNISFFQAERSQGQYKLKENEKRFLRLNKIADVSLKQSGFASTFTLKAFSTLNEVLKSIDSPATSMRFILVPPENNCSAHCHNILSHNTIKNILLPHYTPSAEKRLEQSAHYADSILIIGPEGGFSDQEITDSIERGFEPVSLGLKTLRTETAAQAASLLLSMVCSLA